MSVMRSAIAGLLCAVLMLGSGSALAAAGARDSGRIITVRLSGTHPDWARHGFSDVRLIETFTRRLTGAGYRVVGPAEGLALPEARILSIEVHVNDAVFFDSFHVFLRLKEKAALPASPEGFVTHNVWSDWKVGSFRKDDYPRLEAYILELLDRFLAAPY
jgi:hypothetical protein